MNPTKNDLREDIRAGAVALLNAALATAVDLSLAAKQAHWNVKGPNFLSLHGLFDQVYEQAGEWVDDLAERAVQLGGTAQLPAHAPPPVSGNLVAAIADRLAAFAKQTRAAINAAGDLGDEVTSDLFNEITGGADKQLWMVEAHLQA
jgi:starvation-inducible DNA-binding protein